MNKKILDLTEKKNINLQNCLTFTEAFNKIERKTANKFEQNLDSYIKDADSTIDNIYVYNTLFNPVYALKYLNNKKLMRQLTNKKKYKNLQTINSLKSLNEYQNNKMRNTNNLQKYKNKKNQFKSCEDFRHRNKNKYRNKLNQFNTQNNYNHTNDKKVKFNYNTINNFNPNNNLLYENIVNKLNKSNDNKNIYNDSKNGDIKNLILINNNEFNKYNEANYNSEEENIINAIRKNKFNLLKFNKKKFIKELKKEKKIQQIDEEIEIKENSLFNDKEKNLIKANSKINSIKLNMNLNNIKNENNIQNLFIQNIIQNKNKEENFSQSVPKENIILKENYIKTFNKPNNNSDSIHNEKNNKKFNTSDDSNSDIINNIKKENNNQNSDKSKIKTIKKEDIITKTLNINKNSKYNSTTNIRKLAYLNYNIYNTCIRNIKQNQNFPDILKYVNKQRTFQYKINNINNKIKSEEDILYPNVKLLKNQDKEVNFHKKELKKRRENEDLYNNFKKQLRERYIHKNLTIDAISKVSNKLAFYGRKYFIKNLNYFGDKDFFFKDEMVLNFEKKKNPKKKSKDIIKLKNLVKK